jgi:hypothetical protein
MMPCWELVPLGLPGYKDMGPYLVSMDAFGAYALTA